MAASGRDDKVGLGQIFPTFIISKRGRFGAFDNIEVRAGPSPTAFVVTNGYRKVGVNHLREMTRATTISGIER
jgi:hypothetical protein